MSHNPTWYREYYQRNKLRILEKNEAYRKSHKPQYLQYMRNYYLQHKVSQEPSACSGCQTTREHRSSSGTI